MNTRPVGYYVHHHGAGHLSRARVIRDALSVPMVLLGTGVGAEGVVLADDRLTDCFDGRDVAEHRPDTLHYAPLDHHGIRSRVAAMARWIAEAQPALMIVDVSVEIAMLARLASVPVLYVRLAGDRTDPAHLEAFRSARALIAPFSASMEAPDTPGWVRTKTRYCPGLTAIAHVPMTDSPHVLVVAGRGGKAFVGDQIADAARACPEFEWRAVGPVTEPREMPANLTLAGWTDRIDEEIARASVIVGAAGDGLVTAVIAADRPFICIPEDRPYNEQRMMAAALARAGAAVVLSGWPVAAEWRALLTVAKALDPKPRRAVGDPQGPQRLARWIEGVLSGSALAGVAV